MIYHSRVYGKTKIDESVILDLIKSKDIQRLKYIEQGGYAPLYNNIKKLTISSIIHKRFEHSIGVFILLRKFNAPLKEQIAGLIHDISHGIFSHAIDFVFGRGATQDKSDQIFKRFFLKSDLPNILKKTWLSTKLFFKQKKLSYFRKRFTQSLCRSS